MLSLSNREKVLKSSRSAFILYELNIIPILEKIWLSKGVIRKITIFYSFHQILVKANDNDDDDDD